MVILTIQNRSSQTIPFFVDRIRDDLASQYATIPPKYFGNVTLRPNKTVIVEERRVNIGQIANLQAKGRIGVVRRISDLNNIDDGSISPDFSSISISPSGLALSLSPSPSVSVASPSRSPSISLLSPSASPSASAASPSSSPSVSLSLSASLLSPSVSPSPSPAVALIVDDLLTNYTMIQGADPAILYDEPAPGYAGLTNNGYVGLVDAPQYTPTYLGAPTHGYEFNDDVKVLTQPPGVSAPTKTEMWAVRNLEMRMADSFYSCFDPQWFQHNDGRPFIGSIGSELFSPAEPFLGDQIVTIRYGSNPTIFYGRREVTGYMERPVSRDHATIGSQNFLGFTSGLQKLRNGSRWYMKRAWGEYLTDEQIFSQVDLMTQELADRGVTLAESKSRNLPVVGFYGDSITGGVGPTQHWVKRLQNHIGEGDMRTQIMGYGGITTNGYLARMAEVANSGRLYGDGDFYGVLFLGVNDFLQSGSTATYIANLTTLVTMLRNAGADKVIVMTPMHVNWAALGGDFNTNNASFEAACGQILNGDPGQDLTCDLTGTALGFGSDFNQNRTDGIHPNDSGAEIIAENLGPVLVTAGV